MCPQNWVLGKSPPPSSSKEELFISANNSLCQNSDQFFVAYIHRETDKIKQINYKKLPCHKENQAVNGEMRGERIEVL